MAKPKLYQAYWAEGHHSVIKIESRNPTELENIPAN